MIEASRSEWHWFRLLQINRDLHLSSFLYQEYLLEGEALLQHS